MMKRWILAAWLALGPAAALAFETVDDLPYPSGGAFPAWRPDPVGPWTLFAYGGLMYDSNAFRRDVDEQSDIVARVGAGGRMLTRVVGRQFLLLEGFGEYYDYDHFSEIDHFGYGLRGEVLWEAGNQVNGAAGYSRRHRHGDLGEFRIERKVMITSDRWFVDGGYQFAANWRLFGAAEHTRSERDIDEAGDLDATTFRGNLTYRTPLGNAIGVEARQTRGDARVTEVVTGIAFTNDFDETEIALTLAYGLGAQLRVSGRLGHTERTYDDLEGRNFSGTTYRGLVEWLPTQKIIFGFEAYREPASIIDIDASHVIRTGTVFSASWAATFKLVFTARYLNERRLNAGNIAVEVLGIPPRDETVHVWRFGVGWEPVRHWQLGAAWDIGDRSSNQVGRDYDYQQVMLNARFVF